MIEFTENSTMPSSARVIVSSIPLSAQRKAKVSADIVTSPKRITGRRPMRSETAPMSGPARIPSSVSSPRCAPTTTSE